MGKEKFNYQQLEPNSPLPSLVRQLSQEKINKYAEAVGDFNPIHVDPAFASKTSFGGTIAHGMMVLAYISEVMQAAFGEYWISSGKVSVRFKSPARSTDKVTINGKVESIKESAENHVYKCIVDCHNQDGETIIVGDTEVSVPHKQ
jgi:3-hydroxybutyryl-CoA dehydratase